MYKRANRKCKLLMNLKISETKNNQKEKINIEKKYKIKFQVIQNK